PDLCIQAVCPIVPARPQHASVADDGVETPEKLLGGQDRALYLHLVADVRREYAAVAASGADGTERLLRRRLVHINQPDPGAFACQLEPGGAPDAHPCTCDDGPPAIKPSSHLVIALSRHLARLPAPPGWPPPT